MNLPTRVAIGDITIRDGLQALESVVSTEQKLAFAESLIEAGYRHLEVTNFGNPKAMPQFRDADELLERLLTSERVGHRLKQNGGDVTLLVVAINERAVTRALEFKAKHKVGPDFLLQMVSTDPHHHQVNSGSTLEEYWKMTERCTAMARAEGVRMCGTVSTIWGSPIPGHRETDLSTAVAFARRYLELGADYIEHADHDGSADPAHVYEYFTRILDPGEMGPWSDPKFHLAHFHTTRGLGLANYLAALQAGILRYETTLSAIGGQPANLVDGQFVGGTGGYYHASHLMSGLVSGEDFAVMLAGMGVETGLDLNRVLDLGRKFRDEVLAITNDAMRRWLASVSLATELPLETLLRLRDEPGHLPERIEQATASLARTRPLEAARAQAEQLLRSTRDYLQNGSWAPSRSETLVSGPLPSGAPY